jgi:hypothetical protein
VEWLGLYPSRSLAIMLSRPLLLDTPSFPPGRGSGQSSMRRHALVGEARGLALALHFKRSSKLQVVGHDPLLLYSNHEFLTLRFVLGF